MVIPGPANSCAVAEVLHLPPQAVNDVLDQLVRNAVCDGPWEGANNSCLLVSVVPRRSPVIFVPIYVVQTLRQPSACWKRAQTRQRVPVIPVR